MYCIMVVLNKIAGGALGYMSLLVFITPGACEKVASDLWLGSGFSPGTPVSSTSYNWLVTN